MKYGVFVGAILLVGGALALRETASDRAARPKIERPSAPDRAPESARPGRAPGSDAAPQISNVRVARVKAGASPAPADPYGNAIAQMSRRLMRTLTRELELTAVQRAQVEEVLLRRREAVRHYHRELHATGVFDPSQYDLRTGEIREASYRQIDSLLNADQSARFNGLLAGNGLGDAIAFALDENMVVVK